jgi:hypothetical protein
MINNQNILQCVNFHESSIVPANPVSIENRNKRLVYKVAYHERAKLSHQPSAYMRWRGVDNCDLPGTDEMFPAEDWVEPVAGFYDYKPFRPNNGWEDWHVNFADPSLFAYYGGPLLAQDEMMVAEHPVLANLREHLLAIGCPTLTCEDDRPTPATIRDVPRRCSIDTSPCDDRPNGLYGFRFAMASPDAVRSAVTSIDPPAMTNVIAMSSIPGGYGRYTEDEIGYLLKTAYTGFAAARFQSDSNQVVVHTGFWGCGAFGGNKTLMTLIQVIAASMANVRLVFHYGDESDRAIVEEAVDCFDHNFRWMGSPGFVPALWHWGFQWGRSDGN